MSKQAEIRERITAQIIEALKRGCPPWRKPWSAHSNGHPNGPTNASTGKRYRGINIMLLTLAAAKYGFTSNYWATFNQWRGMGGRIQKRPENVQPGEWGCKIAFYLPVNRKDKAEEVEQDAVDEQDERPRFYMREFTVFNAEQTDAEEFQGKAQGETVSEFVDFAPAEEAVKATGADIRHGGDRAVYRPSPDYIQLPHKDTFISVSEYYSTLAHELVHWSGHSSRLDRKTLNFFGSAEYAFEELIAEIGGCYLCNELNVPQSENLDNHNSYLQSWLKVLENDSSAILRGSAQASKAADFIMAFSKQEAVATA